MLLARRCATLWPHGRRFGASTTLQLHVRPIFPFLPAPGQDTAHTKPTPAGVEQAAKAIGRSGSSVFDTLQYANSPIGRLACLDDESKQAAAKGPVPLYNMFVARGVLDMNCGQAWVVYKLSAIFEGLSQQGCCKALRGIYIHGSVGCGKTMAMDLFAACVHIALPHLNIYRIHLNCFLEMVHSLLRHAGGHGSDSPVTKPCNCRRVTKEPQKPFNLGRQDDRGTRRTGSAAGWVHATRNCSVQTSVELVAQMLADKMDVLCLDEVSITNLQNCVLLGPLMEALSSQGVIVIATSNKLPCDLYEDGLDRDLHLPKLASAVCNHCDVLQLSSNIDHRKLLRRAEGQHTVFKWQCEGAESQTFVDHWWRALSGTSERHPVSVGYGRKLPVFQSRDERCARFSFADLCTFPPVALGSADYVELASRFHTLIVSDVPRLRPEARDAARRWTLFLDSCYENHVRLIISTPATDPEDLLKLSRGMSDGGDSDGQSLKEASFAVSRCTSRLHEMQSQFYLDAFSHRLKLE